MPPTNLGFRITEIFAFIAVADDGDEGIPAFGPMEINGQPMFVPLVSADKPRLNNYRAMAKQIARSFPEQKIRLARFSVREDIEVIEP